MKKLSTVAVAVVMAAVSGFSVAGDLTDGSAVQVRVTTDQKSAPKRHEGFKWGEIKSQSRANANKNVNQISSTSNSATVLASTSQAEPSSYETNGFRWGIRNHYETQGFRWGIR